MHENKWDRPERVCIEKRRVQKHTVAIFIFRNPLEEETKYTMK